MCSLTHLTDKETKAKIAEFTQLINDRGRIQMSDLSDPERYRFYRYLTFSEVRMGEGLTKKE